MRCRPPLRRGVVGRGEECRRSLVAALVLGAASSSTYFIIVVVLLIVMNLMRRRGGRRRGPHGEGRFGARGATFGGGRPFGRGPPAGPQDGPDSTPHR